jgi:hypothetical protein
MTEVQSTQTSNDLESLVVKSRASYEIGRRGFELAVHIPLRKDIGSNAANALDIAKPLASNFGFNTSFSGTIGDQGRLFISLYNGITRKDKDDPGFASDMPVITKATRKLVELLGDYVDSEELSRLRLLRN